MKNQNARNRTPTNRDIYLAKVAESLLTQMQLARDEARKLPESERKSRILRRLEILDALDKVTRD